MTAEELLEIERIHQLRDAYTACVKNRDVAGLADLFCDDAACEFPAELGGSWVGKAEILGGLARGMPAEAERAAAVQVVTKPWVTLTGPDTARGQCFLIDLAAEQAGGESPMRSVGRFEDGYRKVDGGWRFAYIRMPEFWPNPRTA